MMVNAGVTPPSNLARHIIFHNCFVMWLLLVRWLYDTLRTAERSIVDPSYRASAP
jgi:hypothetical protein